jgi:hypothetical protein
MVMVCSESQRGARKSFCQWISRSTVHPTNDEIIAKAQACFNVDLTVMAAAISASVEVVASSQEHENHLAGPSNMNTEA